MILRIRRTEREQAASVFFPGVMLIDVIAYSLKLIHVTFARIILQLRPETWADVLSFLSGYEEFRK